MKRDCLSCGQGEMVHDIRDVSYIYKDHHAVVKKVKGWHCLHCNEVEFNTGEGVRFAQEIKQIAEKIDKQAAEELARIRKKLKLTQHEAAQLTGCGTNHFLASSVERPSQCRRLPTCSNCWIGIPIC